MDSSDPWQPQIHKLTSHTNCSHRGLSMRAVYVCDSALCWWGILNNQQELHNEVCQSLTKAICTNGAFDPNCCQTVIHEISLTGPASSLSSFSCATVQLQPLLFVVLLLILRFVGLDTPGSVAKLSTSSSDISPYSSMHTLTANKNPYKLPNQSKCMTNSKSMINKLRSKWKKQQQCFWKDNNVVWTAKKIILMYNRKFISLQVTLSRVFTRITVKQLRTHRKTKHKQNINGRMKPQFQGAQSDG